MKNDTFYTSVIQKSSKILLRGFKNGRRINEEIPYSPYLFLSAHGKKTEFHTLQGEPVEKLPFPSSYEMFEFVKKYKDTPNFKYYGMPASVYTFINDNYPQGLKYNQSLISIVNLDIEVDTETGYPTVEYASKQITNIVLRKNGKNIAFGLKPYTPRPDTEYILCNDEERLLKDFLITWNSEEWIPDIVTGWNCIPLNQSIWMHDKIVKLKDLNDEDLYDSKLIRKFPISVKEKWCLELNNGKKIYSSGDHQFPVRLINPNEYSDFKKTRKSNFFNTDLKTRQIASFIDCVDVYCAIQLRKNINKDNDKYTFNQLYLAGLIYTDGTLKGKNKYDGYTFFQSDLDLMDALDTFGVDSTISGPYKENYHRYIKQSLLNDAHYLIYDKLKKRLNLEELSTLSYKQFMMFLSGLLDGDGCKAQNTVAWCNYNDDLDTIHELCNWNGIFVTQQKNILRFIDFNAKDLSLLKKKRWNYEISLLKRNSKQKSKDICFKRIGDVYWVKVDGAKYIGTSTRMMDIETDTHYFVTNGVRTHNCLIFDIPYLVRRLRRVFNEKTANLLSPWKSIKERQIKSKFYKEETVYDLHGISILDYIQLYKKFAFTPQPNYSLQQISKSELKAEKLDYSMHANMHEFYVQDHQRFVDYNIHDVELVDQLEEKKGFLKLVIAMAYDAKVNYEDCFTTVRPWDVIIHNYLFDKKIVVPQQDRENLWHGGFEGAYVKEPKCGLYHWVVNFDLNSLYPSVIRFLNLSPETFAGMEKICSVNELLVGKLTWPDFDHSIAANGAIFRKDKKGFLPQLMEDFYNDRVKWKNCEIELKKKKAAGDKSKELANEIDYAHNMQWSKKIQLNACYGALGNEWFRWYDSRYSEAITKTSQVIIRKIEEEVNKALNISIGTTGFDYVIASDTDSIYLNLERAVSIAGAYKKEVDFLDKFAKTEISPVIDKTLVHLAEFFNAFDTTVLQMKREKIANKGIWTGKKHYILNVWDSEGVRYKEPEIDIVGIESVRSSTPTACRTAITDCIKIIMNQDQEAVQKFIVDFKKKFKTLPIDEITFPRGINNMEKYTDARTIYKKGTPIGVKASLIFNNWVKKNNFTEKYQLITESEKIKFCYLKIPNPFKDKVFAFINDIPSELNIAKYIDFDTQFEKGFLNPVEAILSIIGWKSEKHNTLDMFYKD